MGDDHKTSPSPAEIAARLKALKGPEAEQGRETGGGQGPDRPSGRGRAMRIRVELVVTVLVGTAIGSALDRGLGTAPWVMIVFIILGCGAAFSNVYRVVKGLDDSVGLGQAIERKRRAEAEEAARQASAGDQDKSGS